MSARIREERVNLGPVICNIARDTGSDAPLVMLHGVTRRWQTFLPIIPPLAARWNVWALDFRGHGRSDFVDCEYRVIDYLSDAVQLLRSHIDEPAVIYGHSLGAMVAAATAAEVPDLVRAVIMEDPPFETMGKRISETRLLSYFRGMHRLAKSSLPIDELIHDVADLRLIDPFNGSEERLGATRDSAALRFAAMSLAQLDPEVLKTIVAGRWLEGYFQEDILHQIACPVLLLHADPVNGGMLSEENALRVERLAASCTTVKFPGVGHLIHCSKPQEVVIAVHNFLESLEDQHAPICQRTSKETVNEKL